MNGITHERMTRMLFPELNRGMIGKVNRAIDTPQPWMPQPQFGRVPGLSYKGHRKQGHDLLTAGMIGFMEGRLAGVKAAWTHLIMDAAKVQMVRATVCG